MNQKVVLRNRRTGMPLAEHARIARSFWARTVGLLGRSNLGENEALVITSCRMVHMFFMRFPIDVLFCSADHRVVGVEQKLQPWRVSAHYREGSYVVELPAGTAEKLDIRLNDFVEFVPGGMS